MARILISSFLPFPPIAWWAMVIPSQALYLDPGEPFRKMSYRNRYYLCGPQGWMALSIPVQGGREQKKPMKEMRIDQTQPWARQQWRTLVSAYQRSPYFSHYAAGLQPLFDSPPKWLIEFHERSIQWVAQQVGISLPLYESPEEGKKAGMEEVDIRIWGPGIEKKAMDSSPYGQVFLDRNPFYPNLSILDLLFQEGPGTLSWIRNHPSWIEPWIPEPARTFWKNPSSSKPQSSPPG